MKPVTLHTRREFLRSTVLTSALSWTVPTFLANTFSTLQAAAADQATQTATGRDSTILVVLQMAGGNDGLNTVVPFQNDYYRRARPKIAIPANQVLKLNDQIGLHPGLEGFKALYDAGHLSVVQGVGYPNPNRSHFRSTEIWQTASDAERAEYYGWLGRYFDNTCPGCDCSVAVNIGREMPQAFFGKRPKGISIDGRDPLLVGAKRPGDNSKDMERARRELDAPEEEMSNAGGSIGSVSGAAPRPRSSILDFVERTALDARVSTDQVRAISGRVQNRASYPNSQLAESLKLVARLIGGGLSTRIYYVSQGGYDTHSDQLAAHDRLMRELGGSVRAFYDDMKAQGNTGRVLLMTFSEFGRRVDENANTGTDHGAAAPMFIVGDRLKAGLIGRYPGLGPDELFQGDLKYSVDFRSVYAAVLEGWLRTRSETVLGKRFEPLQIV